MDKQDAVYVIQTEHDFGLGADITTVVALPVLKRSKDSVHVARSAASQYKTRLRKEEYFDTAGDAINAYATSIELLEVKLRDAKANLRRMRRELFECRPVKKTKPHKART